MTPARVVRQEAGGQVSKVKVITVELDTSVGVVRAQYEGGAYIDLYPSGSDSATDVVNVWDYGAGRATIAKTPRAVAKAVIGKLREQEQGVVVWEARLCEVVQW